MDRSTVANSLRLLKLPPDLQEMVERGELTAGHGRTLLSFSDVEHQRAWAEKAVRQGLSVRELERAAAQARKGGDSAKKKSSRAVHDPNLVAAEEKLAMRLGAPVSIRTRRRGGSIVIACSDQAELMRVFDLLMGGE
jgi:ParB family chromosome partitioning protein